MVRIPRSLALVGGFCFFTLLSAAPALAQNADATTGLGQSWPNASDVSTSPHYHVYVFRKDGIRYFQVNDLNGNVRAAVAVANGVVLTLPIGLDASEVTHSATPQTGNASETVYNDKGVTLTATPKQNGHVLINTATANDEACEPPDCAVTGVTGQIGTPAPSTTN
ncbi:hypothetical protein EKH79_01630 [Dyella dinghuensis]|uniref:Uncharacterized protein n=1 Tax=Dyella dinghuensis TaxID=1920169 RepID=A0A432LYK9_9GAMM|nr:hypothetical protein [Dyella dinghuensis]RUL66553.1 hypothetical protein EKH79_01630 [Dyella dinghuensis]